MRSARSPHAAPSFAWRSLEQRIHDHLMDEGMSKTGAARLSREIIAICAADAETLDPERMDERALDEACTLLQTWQAMRREQLLEAT